MGQLISAHPNDQCNDQLINTLIKREFISTVDVEKVFRCVDRGFYCTGEEKHIAYRDLALQSDQIHLSAPCVYATVLECLELRPGHKFLNIGSGIGYFSTVAGFLLGRNGVNHGIEIHQSLVDLAYQKMEEFKLNSAAMDHYHFCEPVFIQGNVCELVQTGYYDRVYCGAAVPPMESDFLKSLINIGGVIVMPLDGFLVKVTRTDKNTWLPEQVLDVSFKELVLPKNSNFNTVKFPSVEPLSLQELCRSNIRSVLRENLKQQFPMLPMRTKCQLKTNTKEHKCLNVDNAFAQLVRLQYGLGNEGLVNIQNIVESFAGLDEAISETSSVSDDEHNEGSGENVEHNIDTVFEHSEIRRLDGEESERRKFDVMQTTLHSDQTRDESTKRKSVEAGCSEQNKTLTETENTKRMKMDSALKETESTTSHSDLWETVSVDKSGSTSYPKGDDDDDDDDEEEDDEDENGRGHFGRIYNSLFNGYESDDSTDSEVAREIVMYGFVTDHKVNELSKLLRAKIDSLPLPVPLKVFLNYNRTN